MRNSEKILLEESIEKYEALIDSYKKRQKRAGTWTKNKNLFQGMISAFSIVVEDFKEKLDLISKKPTQDSDLYEMELYETDGLEYEIWEDKAGRLWEISVERGEDSESGEPDIERDWNSVEIKKIK